MSAHANGLRFGAGTLLRAIAIVLAAAVAALPGPACAQATSALRLLPAGLKQHRVTNAAVAPTTLYYAYALALAPNGNLYVANTYADSILIYNTKLVKQTAATITSGISRQSFLGFDAESDLYVSNGSDIVTVYGPLGNQIATRSCPLAAAPRLAILGRRVEL